MVSTQRKQSSLHRSFSWLSALSGALASIGSVLCAIVVTSLAALTLLVSAHFPFAEGLVYSEKQDLTNLLSVVGLGGAATTVICACVLFGLIFVFWRTRIGSVKPRDFLVAVLAWAFLFQLAWILSLRAQAFVYADSLELSTSASDILSGDLAAFVLTSFADPDPASYFHMYPYQAGSLYVFVLMKALFGENFVQPFQIVNAVCNCVVIYCLFSMSKSLGSSKRVQNVCLLLCGICFPLLFSCAFVYGNSIGLAFSCAAIALLMNGLAQSDRKARLVRIAVSFALIALAIVAKATCIIYFIVMVIILLLEAMKRIDVPLAVVTLACALVAYQISGVPLQALESQTGADFGRGMPRTSWIAMGLRDDNPLSMPGWWGLYAYNVLAESDGDYDAQTDTTTNDIRNSLQGFLEYPSDGAQFFAVKLASEWSDPTFQSLYYSTLSTNEPESGGVAIVGEDSTAIHNYGKLARTTLYGAMHKPMFLFMDAFQTVVMTFAAIYMIRLCKKENRKENQSLKLVIPLTVFVGFFVYLLWEAKSVYLMSFFVMMIPLAASQIDSGCKRFERTLKLTPKNSD